MTTEEINYAKKMVNQGISGTQVYMLYTDIFNELNNFYNFN